MAPAGSPRSPDSRLVVFSTHDVAEADRAAYWDRVTAGYFGRLETRATGRADFKAILATRAVSFLQTYRLCAGGHQAWRRRSDDGVVPDAIKLLLQVRGRCRVDQEGRTAEFGPGSWCLYDTWRPYGIVNFGGVEQIVIQIPRDRIIDGNLRRLAEPFFADAARSAMARIAASFIRSYAGSALGAEGGDEFLAETTIGLVRRAMHAGLSRQRCAQAPSSQLRARIKQFILAHLTDPDLSIDRIAAAMGCSKRYLHQVFAAEEVTIERYIWRLRVDQCCQALAEPEQLDKSISAIAFEWGFNSSAHFSRVFKAQVGVAPTEFRRTLGIAALHALPGLGTA